jgi:peptidylprolyl isomerase
MRASARICLSLAAVGLVGGLLGACGSTSSGSALPTASGTFASTASISIPSSGPPSSLKVIVVRRGHGPVVKKGQLLVADYVGKIWGGKVFDSSFSRHVASAFPIGLGHVIPGWDTALVGAHAGSRLLLVIPPAEGYGAKGQPSAGIKGTDTLVFVVDVIASYSKTATVAGAHTLHTSVHGITVTWPTASPPTVHVPASETAPKSPTVTVLSRGTGHRIAPGLVVLQYEVINAKTNQVVGSTYQLGYPDGENVGSQPSLLTKLLGLPVGTRVLLRTPATSSGGPYVFALEVVAEPSLLG